MAAGVMIEIKGFEEMANKFEQFKTDLVAMAIPNTIRRTLELAEVTARNFVPVRTGFLRDSIHIVEGETIEGGQLIADAPYAGFVEFGTSKMSARPYMQSAYEEVQRSISNILIDEIGAAL